jgi:hypothetical protein
VLSPLISGEPITSTPKVLVIDQITFRNITLVVELTGAYMLFDQHASLPRIWTARLSTMQCGYRSRRSPELTAPGGPAYDVVL